MLGRPVDEPFHGPAPRSRRRGALATRSIILPNNKNIRPVAEQVDALTKRTVRVVPTRQHRRGVPAPSSPTTPAPSVDVNEAAMVASAARVLPAEADTGPSAPPLTEAGQVLEGDWIGLTRDTVVSVADSAAGAAFALLDRLLVAEHELVTLIEGEGATAADTRRITAWLHDEHPDVATEVHHGGQPNYPYLLGIEWTACRPPMTGRTASAEADHPGPGAEPARAGGRADRPPVRPVRPRRRAALGANGVDTVFDLLTTYPHRYIDRSRQVEVADLAVGDEAVVLAEVTSVRPRRTRQGRSLVEASVRDQSGGMKVVFFNQPWRAKQLAVGTEALFFGKLTEYRGSRQMTNPVVDVLVSTEGSGRGARMLRVIPVYPASAKVGLSSWEVGEWVAEALRRVPSFADPVPRGVAGPPRRWWAGARPSPAPTCPRRWPTRARPAAGSPSTSCSGSSWRWCCAAGPWRPTPGPSATPSPRRSTPTSRWGPRTRPGRRGAARAGPAVSRRPALRPDRRPAAGPGRRSSPRWRDPSPCTGSSKATWGRARRWWPWPPSWRPSRAATREPLWCPPRCWPSSTTWRCGP